MDMVAEIHAGGAGVARTLYMVKLKTLHMRSAASPEGNDVTLCSGSGGLLRARYSPSKVAVAVGVLHRRASLLWRLEGTAHATVYAFSLRSISRSRRRNQGCCTVSFSRDI